MTKAELELLTPAPCTAADPPQRRRLSYRPGASTSRGSILHSLNNLTGEIQLVDEAATVSAEVEAFFSAHIEAALLRADWQARFSEPTGEVASLCRDSAWHIRAICGGFAAAGSSALYPDAPTHHRAGRFRRADLPSR